MISAITAPTGWILVLLARILADLPAFQPQVGLRHY
jgi:hypothetical protein